jgi:hypothetical protein
MPLQVTNVRDDYAVGQRTIKLLSVGPPGAGKTRTASTWPNVLYADIEGRLLSVRDRDVRRARILTLADMDELRAMLEQKPDVRTRIFGAPVETVVIDTVDELARLIIRERLREERQEAMRMQDWGYLGDTLRGLLRGFRNLDDLNVVFNCHLKDTRDDESGRIEKKPDIQGSVGNEIAAYVDESFLLVARPYLDPATGQRAVKRYWQTYPDAQHDWVKDHSGTLPMEFPIDFDTDYERLAKLIFGDPRPAPEPALSVESTLDIEPPPPAPEAKAPAKRKARAAAPEPPAEHAPEPPAAAPKPAPEPTPETTVPETGTPNAPVEVAAGPLCAECGKVVDNVEVAELSDVRYGVVLCREHFVARRNAK